MKAFKGFEYIKKLVETPSKELPTKPFTENDFIDSMNILKQRGYMGDEVKSPRSGDCSNGCGGCSGNGNEDLDENPIDLTDEELKTGFKKALERPCDCEKPCDSCSCEKCECGADAVGNPFHADYCPKSKK